MTKAELEARASELEDLLDNSLEDSLPGVEQELCNIYGMLRKMGELEAQ